MAQKQKRILIVEDEQAIANAMRLKFEHGGLDATIAGNGQEALDILKKEKFDLILLDLVMPVMDGFTTLEALKKQGNKTPVIVTSNLSQTEDQDKAKKLGAVDYFVKSNTPITDVLAFVLKKTK